MTALTLRASHSLLHSPAAVFGRFFSVIATFMDVYAEAQKQATEAHRKFPLADW